MYACRCSCLASVVFRMRRELIDDESETLNRFRTRVRRECGWRHILLIRRRIFRRWGFPKVFLGKPTYTWPSTWNLANPTRFAPCHLIFAIFVNKMDFIVWTGFIAIFIFYFDSSRAVNRLINWHRSALKATTMQALRYFHSLHLISSF